MSTADFTVLFFLQPIIVVEIFDFDAHLCQERESCYSFIKLYKCTISLRTR